MATQFDGQIWHRFQDNRLIKTGLFILVCIMFATTFAELVVPFPQHIGPLGDMTALGKPPNSTHMFGTDLLGRDLFTRIIFAYRISFTMGLVVLSIAVPVGVLIGLVAGYMGGRIEYLLMRLTDVFLAVPPLILAMAIMGFLQPTLTNGMIAVTAGWWPWYSRLIYNVARSEAQEGYIIAARLIGASVPHILFSEILPNCLPSIVTKMTLDFGFVILTISSLSFLGLGVQPPTPDLGSMVSDGAKYMPDAWWLTVFPSLAIALVVMGFNLVGDGLRETFDAD